MAIFVLVHGAWGGAHGFRKVRGPLREAGHEVFTPSTNHMIPANRPGDLVRMLLELA